MLTVTIIQARTGSTRFPKKVLKLINGRPMLWHLIERVKKSCLKNKIIVATTKNPQDKVIINLAKTCRVSYFAGSEDDVLSRFYEASIKFGADAIVRISSDCPLICPEVIDAIVSFYKEHVKKYDLVLLKGYPLGFGTELFSFKALEETWKAAKLISDREHVSLFMKKHPNRFRVGYVKYSNNYSNMAIGGVDYQEDFEFISEVFHSLQKEGKEGLTVQEIVNLVKDDPQLLKWSMMRPLRIEK